MRHIAPALILILWAASAQAADSSRDAVSSQDIERLKRQIHEETRSHVELLFDGHGETGGRNDKLGFWRVGAKLNLKRKKPGESFYLVGARTQYSTDADGLAAAGHRGAAGFQGKRAGWDTHVELGLTRFDTDATTVDGLLSVSRRPTDAARVSILASRTNVEESLLSVAGLTPIHGPFAGQHVGTVMENRVGVSGDYRLPHRLDVYGEASIGTRAGANVGSNFMRRAGGGLGWAAIAREEDRPLSLVRLSVAVDYFGFRDDRFGYGGVSLLDEAYEPLPLDALGSDGLSPEPAEGHPGVGGYFSPSRFVGTVARVDVKGRPGDAWEYRVSAFAGKQTYTGSASRGVAGITATAVYRLSDRISVPLTTLWDDYGPFRQQSVLARLVARF